MRAILFKIKQFVSYLNIRERILLFLVALAVIFLLWFLLLWRPLYSDNYNLKIQLVTMRQESETMQKELQVSQERLNRAQDTTLTSKQKELQERKQQLDKMVTDLQTHLIPPEKMAVVLKDLFHENDRLELISLTKLPTLTMAQFGKYFQVYKHGIVLKFSGDFFSTLNYLEAVEKLKWRFFMDQLIYKVTKYPKAEITMRVHTLSTQEGWLYA